jgi:hypothetical protein
MDSTDPCFIDAIIPDTVWERIAPQPDVMLCLPCIVRRLRFKGEENIRCWILKGPLASDWEGDIPFDMVGPAAYGWTMQHLLDLTDREREKLKKRMGVVAALRRATEANPHMARRERFEQAGRQCRVSGSTVGRIWAAAQARPLEPEKALLPATRRREPPLTPVLRQWIADEVARNPGLRASAILSATRQKIVEAGLEVPSIRSVQRVVRYLQEGGTPFGGGQSELYETESWREEPGDAQEN